MKKRQNTITVDTLSRSGKGYRWRDEKVIDYKTRQNL